MATKTFKIEIALGNAAMKTGNDVAAALDEAARYLRAHWGDHTMGTSPDGQEPRGIRDENGNRVGSWEVVS